MIQQNPAERGSEGRQAQLCASARPSPRAVLWAPKMIGEKMNADFLKSRWVPSRPPFRSEEVLPAVGGLGSVQRRAPLCALPLGSAWGGGSPPPTSDLSFNSGRSQNQHRLPSLRVLAAPRAQSQRRGLAGHPQWACCVRALTGPCPPCQHRPCGFVYREPVSFAARIVVPKVCLFTRTVLRICRVRSDRPPRLT